MSYNLDAVIKIVREVYKDSTSPIRLHGGEPLCMPIEDVERLLAVAYELVGHCDIETNGSLITERHIELFKKYKTGVGISIDGPDELNEFRTTKDITKKVLNIMETMRKENIGVSVIVVIHQANAGTDERLTKLKEWLSWLNSSGIESVRLNPLDILDGSYGRDKYCLNEERLIYTYRELGKLMLENRCRWAPFSDIWNALQKKDPVVCIFKPCDPYHTPDTIILGDGTITNCLRREIALQHSEQIFKREELLQKMSMEYGGCKECEYFPFCNGGCPANGMNGSWQNRDVNCPMYRAVFELIENALKVQGISIRT